jgi:hypothetical protein
MKKQINKLKINSSFFIRQKLKPILKQLHILNYVLKNRNGNFALKLVQGVKTGLTLLPITSFGIPKAKHNF